MGYRLEDIRKSVENENISYDEILYLQNHKADVYEYGDTILAEWAGIDEDEWNDKKIKS